jgi:hypothetical protein
MSLASIVSGLLNTILSSSGSIGKIAESAGVTTITISGTKVSISALVAALAALAKENPGNALLTSLHFTSVKDFLLSQQFESDLVDIADLLGVIGLAVPPVAVAANDLRELAMILTVAHSVASGLIALGVFSDLIAVPGGGFVSKAWANDPRHQLDKNGNFIN